MTMSSRERQEIHSRACDIPQLRKGVYEGKRDSTFRGGTSESVADPGVHDNKSGIRLSHEEPIQSHTIERWSQINSQCDLQRNVSCSGVHRTNGNNKPDDTQCERDTDVPKAFTGLV